jgi:hypothetical protein
MVDMTGSRIKTHGHESGNASKGIVRHCQISVIPFGTVAVRVYHYPPETEHDDAQLSLKDTSEIRRSTFGDDINIRTEPRLRWHHHLSKQRPREDELVHGRPRNVPRQRQRQGSQSLSNESTSAANWFDRCGFDGPCLTSSATLGAESLGYNLFAKLSHLRLLKLTDSVRSCAQGKTIIMIDQKAAALFVRR